VRLIHDLLDQGRRTITLRHLAPSTRYISRFSVTPHGDAMGGRPGQHVLALCQPNIQVTEKRDGAHAQHLATVKNSGTWPTEKGKPLIIEMDLRGGLCVCVCVCFVWDAMRSRQNNGVWRNFQITGPLCITNGSI